MSQDPFSILGLEPFLYTPSELEGAFKAHVLKLARKFHPDRFLNASDDERRKAEEKSAEINQAVQQIQDPWKRLGFVLKLLAPSHSTQQEKSLPEIALEYFQVQEALEENSGDSNKIIDNFSAKLSDKLASIDQQLKSLSRPYILDLPNAETKIPTSTPPRPWPPSSDELQRLLALFQQRNYIKRMMENLGATKKGPL
jgi:molecular chaperone HscB